MYIVDIERGQQTPTKGCAMSTYGWVITKDKLCEGEGDRNDKGTMGPRSMPEEIVQRLNSGEGRTFRMLDDDEEIYYYGRYIGDDSEDMLGPLDDFGMPNAGCTMIQYKNEDGKYETI